MIKIPEERLEVRRVVYMDLLRISAVFSMMLLHVVATNWGTVSVISFDWKIFNVYDSLVRFCVPALVMVSGAFLLDPNKEYTFRKLFSKNILRIVTAFVFWSACYAIYYGFSHYDTINSSIIEDVLTHFLLGRYHLWFLYTLIGLYLIVPFLRKIVVDPKLCRYFIILSILFGSIIPFIIKVPYFWLGNELLVKANFHFVLGYVGYFVAGYYLKAHTTLKTTNALLYLFGIIGITATIGLTAMLSAKYGEPTNTFYSYFAPNCWMVSIAVFLFFKQAIGKINFSDRTIKGIIFVSKCSFGMYLVHDFFITFICTYLGYTTISFNPILSVPLITLSVFILSFLTSYIINKIPFLNKYIV